MDARIHIGTPKTGTTTLQDFLFKNSSALERQGFLFRRYGREDNQPELVAATFHRLGDLLGDPFLKVALGIRTLEDQAGLVRKLDARIAADCALQPDATMLFSCELLGAPGRGPRFVAGFRDWVQEHFREVGIVLYIRRQDRYAESSYSQYLRGGGDKTLERYLEDFQPPNYNRMVRLWEDAFGEANVTVRRLQASDLAGGDLIEDYCATVGIRPEGLARPKTLNSSFSTRQAARIRAANARVPAVLRQHGHANRLVRWLIRATATALVPGDGPRVRMSDDARTELLRSVAGSNDLLRRRRFPEANRLFD